MKRIYTDPLKDQYHILSNKRDLNRLEKIGTLRHFPKDYIIDFRDRAPECFYLILKGRIMVYEDSYQGEHRVYNIMRSGSLILEEYVLFPKPCPVLFKTLTHSELVEIDRCELIRAMKKDIDISLDLLESVCGKFVSSMEEMRIGPRQHAEWKICRMILSDLDNYGLPLDGGMVVREKISHQMLADILGLNRVTVTRIIKKLRDQGLISQRNGLMFVPDIQVFLDHMDDLEKQ